jgi:hypothetical protein
METVNNWASVEHCDNLSHLTERFSIYLRLFPAMTYASLWVHQSGGFLASEGAACFEAAT